MIVTWHDDKNKANYMKHDIWFEEAQRVFDDINAVTLIGEIIDNEERWRTIGKIREHWVILVAHTYVEEDGEEYVRIISARKLSTGEVKKYEYYG